MHLQNLEKILTENRDQIYPCITDLVANGLSLERFQDETNRPTRQDITQYLASWFKYAGLSPDECLDWMIEYCTSTLSVLSSSSHSKIRHSTKSNVKYIYRSEVTFNCFCENNSFKATCNTTCPVYNEMTEAAVRKQKEIATKVYEIPRSTMVQALVEIPSMKDQYKEQFDQALDFIQQQIKERVKKKYIVKHLNEKGFKSKTGKDWSYGTLLNELSKFKQQKAN